MGWGVVEVEETAVEGVEVVEAAVEAAVEGVEGVKDSFCDNVCLLHKPMAACMVSLEENHHFENSIRLLRLSHT